MEPCRTITADLDVKQKGNEVFEIGDVIHIPQLKGIHCPDGQVNPDGLFVIGQDYRKPNAGTSKFELFLGSCKQLKGDVCGDQLMAGVVAKLKSEIDYCYVKNVSEDD